MPECWSVEVLKYSKSSGLFTNDCWPAFAVVEIDFLAPLSYFIFLFKAIVPNLGAGR
jgi:hypothetical protein